MALDTDAVAGATDRVASLLVAAGAEAVVLMGSHARGQGHRYSDLDVLAIGDGTSRLREFDGWQVSEQWSSEADARAMLYNPTEVGCSVPGWRTTRILHDPTGCAAGLKAEADAWTWTLVGDKPNHEVAKQLVGNCEEVHRLVGNLMCERWMAAAFVRSVLALHCAGILAIHLRLLYATENRLWSMVAETMGAQWSATQEAAFGFRGEDVRESALAALRLFELTAQAAESVLDGSQRDVMTLAIGAIADLRSS